MKYLIFTSCVHVDILSQKGADTFLNEVSEFHCMTTSKKTREEDFYVALKKVERYGSFIFVSEKVFNQLLPKSEE